MKISGERLLSDLNKFKSYTDTQDAGVTRFSYGKSDEKLRFHLKEIARSYGFKSRTDAIGNMYISLQARDQTAQRICIGSHIDTVRDGGWLDGVYGVVAGLEVLRTLAENTNNNVGEVELVIFAEEEGSNFASTMTGSKFVSGIYGEKELDQLKDDRGVSLRETLERCGYPSFKSEELVWDFSQIKAMLELHIEQGPILEEKRKSIGIVETIYGMTTIEVGITGVGNHAGATPMSYRRDALTTAALCITEVERIAKEDPEGILVATVGKVSVFPNCSNVIPEKVSFTLEVRHKDEETIKKVLKKMETSMHKISEERATDLEIHTLAKSKPFTMDAAMIELMVRLANEAQISYGLMNSGAVHDTCMIAPHAPSAMLFVPSIGGRSHVPCEDTDPAELVIGAQLLLNIVLEI